MAKGINLQSYRRIKDENSRYDGMIDESQYEQHIFKIDIDKFKEIIKEAILYAEKKSSRRILNIDDSADDTEIHKILHKSGKQLFDYFKKYCGDPAATAHDCLNRHYREIAEEQFRNRSLQKERMNSGWRYQFIVVNAAALTRRFSSVSDLGLIEADFNAILKEGYGKEAVSIYVSVKNRANTMGGQDWPKAIKALELVASTDKNRKHPYICVFGIAMDRGKRNIKATKAGQIYSPNTEVWMSDFFWPFFTNYSYEEVTKAVLDVLMAFHKKTEIEIPEQLIESFGESCKENGLVDEDGVFRDPYKIVEVFCRPSSKSRAPKKAAIEVKKAGFITVRKRARRK
jgi:hypothetical protein